MNELSFEQRVAFDLGDLMMQLRKSESENESMRLHIETLQREIESLRQGGDQH